MEAASSPYEHELTHRVGVDECPLLSQTYDLIRDPLFLSLLEVGVGSFGDTAKAFASIWGLFRWLLLSKETLSRHGGVFVANSLEKRACLS